MRNPKVSVGLPVYNGGRYLREALDSVLGQSFREFELIISDNASSDDTAEVCRAYAAGDDRVRFFRQPENCGMARNSNFVFGESRGQYFRWASHDDYTTSDHLEKCVAILESKPDVVLCFSEALLIDGSGSVIGEYDERLELLQSLPSERYRGCLDNIRLCNLPYGLIRREALLETSLNGMHFGSDIDLILELSLRGKFYRIPERLFYRRMHPEAASQLDKEGVELAVHYGLKSGDDRTRLMQSWINLRCRIRAVLRSTIPVLEKVRIVTHLLRRAFWMRREFAAEIRSVMGMLRGSRGPGRHGQCRLSKPEVELGRKG